MFYNISKHLEARPEYSVRRIVNSFLGVLQCGMTQSLVFDILRSLICVPRLRRNEMMVMMIFILLSNVKIVQWREYNTTYYEERRVSEQQHSFYPKVRLKIV